MTARLPVPGSDNDTWGDILNAFLQISHNSDGTLQSSAVMQAGGVASSQVGAANGIAGLNSSGIVPTTQLGVGTASSSNFLRGDGTWAVPSGSGGGSSTLAGDTDVTITAPSNSQVLTYNSSSSKWVNQAAPVTSVAGKTGAVTLAESDVTNLATDLGSKLTASNNLSDLGSASQARTNLGLGSAATQNKVAAGSSGVLDATDPTTTNSRAPTGSAGGDLSGTYPNPTVSKVNGVTLPASAPTGSGQVLTSTSTSATAWQTPGSAPVSSVFTRTGAVTAQSGDYTASQVTNAADKSSASAQTFTGNVSAPALIAGGLTGATQASRYVGATASGAPASGTFAVGDFIIDQTAAIWVCTAAGSPGTWKVAHLTLDATASDIQALGTQAAGSTGKAADAGHVHPTTGLAVLAGSTFTGYVAPAGSTLTFGSSIAVNAALGNDFSVTLTASTGTLANPTNPTSWQIIRFHITQGTGGSFTLAYGTAYDFGSAGTPTLTTSAGKVDIVAFQYDPNLTKWCFTGAGLGY